MVKAGVLVVGLVGVAGDQHTLEGEQVGLGLAPVVQELQVGRDARDVHALEERGVVLRAGVVAEVGHHEARGAEVAGGEVDVVVEVGAQVLDVAVGPRC
jgi:hypothetical protein